MIYPNRYECEPRLRAAYIVACDLIAVYGAPRNSFDYKNFNLNRREMKEVWGFALNDMTGKSRYDFIQKVGAA